MLPSRCRDPRRARPSFVRSSRLALFALFASFAAMLWPPAAAHAQTPPSPSMPWSGFVDHLGRGYDDQPASAAIHTTTRAVTQDGAWVVFDSAAPNLWPDPLDGMTNVYFFPRWGRYPYLISTPAHGTAANGHSWNASIANDRRWVVFLSSASNLVWGDTNGRVDVFLADTWSSHSITRLNVGPGGVEDTADAVDVSISSTGRFITWVGGSPAAVHLLDRDTDSDGILDEPGATQTEIVSLSEENEPANGDAYQARVSDDGRFVAFDATATNLVWDVTTGTTRHLYLRDRTFQETRLLTRTHTGAPSAAGIVPNTFDLSRDGQFVTFSSNDAPLDQHFNDTNGTSDLFVQEQMLGSTQLMSHGPQGEASNGATGATVISADNRHVLFQTTATNIVPGQAPAASGAWMLFAIDRFTHITTRVDASPSGVGFNGAAGSPSISAWSQTVIFTSNATNVPNGATDPTHASLYTSDFFQFELTPALPAEVPTEGLQTTIAVQAAPLFDWDAVASAPWIWLDEYQASPGRGARNILLVVYENTTSATRTATVRVGQQTFTVTQAGVPTPPVITPVVTGPLGQNGWYTGNVSVTWTIVHPESPITWSSPGCQPTMITQDTIGDTLTCEATSDGGTSSASIVIKRDATPPVVSITSPRAEIYARNAVANVAFSCADATSGLALWSTPAGDVECNAASPVGSVIDTSTPGFRGFQVSARDLAGHETTRTVSYAVSTGECSAIGPHMYAWWRFENTLRDTTASSDLTRVGLTADRYAPAIVGQGYVLGPEDGYLQSNLRIDVLQDGLLAIAAWIKPAADGFGVIVSKRDQYRVARLANGNLGWAFKVPTAPTFTYVDTGAPLPLDTWSHILVSRDATQVRAYVNGRLVRTDPAPLIGFPWDNAAYLTIGGVADAAQFFKGAVDEVQVTRNPLTLEQIEGLYLSGSAGKCVPKASVIDIPSVVQATYNDPTFRVPIVLRTTDGQRIAGRTLKIVTYTGPWPSVRNDYTVTTDQDGAVAFEAPLNGSPANSSSTTQYTLFRIFFPGDYLYRSTDTLERPVRISPARATVTWNEPAAITYGTALSSAQLNATANTAGTFTYTPWSGAVPLAGTRTLSVQFTPSDTANWYGATTTTTLIVNKATPTVTITGGPFTYDGQPHAVTTKATGVRFDTLTPVSVTYNGAATVPVAAGVYTVIASYAGNENYLPKEASGTLTIQKAAPQLTASGGTFTYDGAPHAVTASLTGAGGAPLTPIEITYNGLADVPIAAGVYAVDVRYAGSENYTAASATTTITITKATPVVTASGGTFTYDGLPHASTASVTGVGGAVLTPVQITYNGLSDVPVAAGVYAVEARYAGSENYIAASGTASLTIAKATPLITATGGTFTYDGAPHAATASVTGVGGAPLAPIEITYNGQAAAPVNAGAYAVEARFAGDQNYVAVSTTTTITIEKASTSVSWATPSSVTYGTALGAAQLNATSTIDGTFAYTPAAGTVLDAGARTLSVAFTPTDTANYSASSASVTLTVLQATPVITWPAPAPIMYGTPVSSAQLNASTTVAGTFRYAPLAGTILVAGERQLGVSFYPEDRANYGDYVNAYVPLTVLRAPLAIRANDVTKPYGAPMPAFTATATGFVNGESMASLLGTLAFSAPQDPNTPVGAYPITPGGPISYNYAIAYASGTLTVTAAQTVVTLTSSATPLGANQAVSWTATVSVVAPGAGLPTGPVEFRDGATRLGTVWLTNGVATLGTNGLTTGAHTISAIYAGDPRFAGSTGSLTQTVNGTAASSTTTVTSSAGTATVGVNVTLTATVTAPTGGATGTVEFFDGNSSIGSATISSGKAKLTLSTLAAGAHAITARFAGNAIAPPSVSPVFVQNVAPFGAFLRASSVTLAASPSPATLDNVVTFTATVSGGWNTQPTGRVLFMVNGRVIGDAAGVVVTRVNSTTARAVLTVNPLAKGRHAVTATYLGDSYYKGQTSTVTLVVD